MKNDKIRNIIVISIVMILIITLGISFATYGKLRTGRDNNVVISGDVYIRFNGMDKIVSNTLIPMTKSEALANNDNIYEFSIISKNTSEKNLNYGIKLENTGNINTNDIMVYLEEIDEDNKTKVVIDGLRYPDFENYIYANFVKANTNEEITRNYKMRVWLRDGIIISDTESDATYSTNEWQTRTLGLNVILEGDFTEKLVPLTYNYIPEINSFNLNLANENKDNLRLKITSNDERIKFNYSYTNVTPSQTEGGEDTETVVEKTNQTSVDLSFNDAKDISLDVKGALSTGEDITFEVLKDNVTIEKFIITVYKTANDINIMGTFPSSITDNKESITKVEFKNVSQSVLESDYPIILTYNDDGELRGDVRAKLENGTLTIGSDGTTYLKTGYYLFSEFTNLSNIDFTNVDTSLVASMYGMFNNCSSLTSLELSNFNTSKVTSMRAMFNECSSLVQLDLSSFDTSKVETMRSMFYGCSSLEQLDLSNFDTSKVTTMFCMFNGCSSLEELDISNFDTNNVINMQSMFYNCNSLTSLDLSSFNTSKVTTMYQMFYSCSGLTELNLTNFDTSKVTTMSNMFTGCSGLTELNVTNFDTSKVTSMRSMFNGCSGLTSLDVSNFNTSKVTTMMGMFKGCSGLTELDITNFDTSSLRSIYEMFRNCSNLTELDLSNFNTSAMTDTTALYNTFFYCSKLTTIYASELFVINDSVTNMSSTFNGCNKLVGGNGTKKNSNNGMYARLDNPPDSPGYFTYKAAPNKS